MSLNGLGSFNNNISNIEKQQPVNKASEAPKNNSNVADINKTENTSVKDTANIKVQSSSKPVNVVSFDFDNKKTENVAKTAGVAALTLVDPVLGLSALATMIYLEAKKQ